METDKTQMQDREHVGYKQQSNSGNDATLFFSTQFGITEEPTDRPQKRKTESRRRINDTKTIFITQLTNGPPIHKSKFMHFIEFTIKGKVSFYLLSQPKYYITTFVRKRKQSRNATNNNNKKKNLSFLHHFKSTKLQ